MTDKARPAISDAERDVLKILWDRGPGTVRTIQRFLVAQGQSWARSTVITLLQRLEKKGYAKSDKRRFAFVFRAAVSLEEVLHEQIVRLAEELSKGDPAPLVLAFARRHRFSAEEIQQFRQMIEQMEAKRSRKKSDK
ncbi:MAG TPA: BlaI/MecI/CopY family transcriptional regulator [Pirellulales bacterium]|jgi:predicted transcriptional regulator|nr:BlaI/MecI/CopY family transcriptional regulator [Pirellulales bacterium]